MFNSLIFFHSAKHQKATFIQMQNQGLYHMGGYKLADADEEPHPHPGLRRGYQLLHQGSASIH